MLTYSNNALWTNQLDELVGGASLGVSLAIIFQVSQVTNMADLIVWSTMCLAVWVDYTGYQIQQLSILFSTYSEDLRMCSRWCCHQIDECGILARHWHHGQRYPMKCWLGQTRILARR
jgi:hypothetical protein